MEEFETYRPLLFSIAYRMLGSAMEAEDVLQEAYLRYNKLAPGQVTAPKTYLSKMVTNLCLDQLKSARAQRELYVGSWLPEPILTADHSSEMELESISMAFLVLLEKLTPAERAVFLLHEVFDYSYPEIAEILGKDQAACRQLLHRARQHISTHRPRFQSTPEEHQVILGKFMSAVGEGDMEGLVNLLAEDAAMWSDGGGKVYAARRPIFGRANVVKLLLGLKRFYVPNMSFETATVNATPSIIVRVDGEVRLVMLLEISEGVIKTVRSILNPDKLRYLSRQ